MHPFRVVAFADLLDQVSARSDQSFDRDENTLDFYQAALLCDPKCLAELSLVWRLGQDFCRSNGEVRLSKVVYVQER